MLDLLLCLLDLLVAELDHILLLLHALNGLLKFTLNLVQPAELMFKLVFLGSDILNFLHQSSVLLLQLLNISL